MSEQLNGHFNTARAAKISEPEFKRLCGEVWAESVIELDWQEEDEPPRPVHTDKECALLRAVLLRLRHKLDQEADGLEDGFKFANDQSALYRDEIRRIMIQSSDVPFDYHKIINRLLREIVTEETV
jgi:hypothetical protein